MKIALTWDKPIRLNDGTKFNQVYYCPNLDLISNKAGVYVFARSFGTRAGAQPLKSLLASL